MNDRKAFGLIRDFNRSHSNNREDDVLLIERLRERGLTVIQIASVLQVIDSTCTKCWNGNRTCKCVP